MNNIKTFFKEIAETNLEVKNAINEIKQTIENSTKNTESDIYEEN